MERRRGVGHLKRDDADAVAVLAHVLGDRMVRTQRGREHQPDVALLQHVGGRVAIPGLETAIGRRGEAEGRRVKGGRLLGVADVELEVVDSSGSGRNQPSSHSPMPDRPAHYAITQPVKQY